MKTLPLLQQQTVEVILARARNEAYPAGTYKHLPEPEWTALIRAAMLEAHMLGQATAQPSTQALEVARAEGKAEGIAIGTRLARARMIGTLEQLIQSLRQ